MTQTRWLIYAAPTTAEIAHFLAQTTVYALLLCGAALFDLRRRISDAGTRRRRLSHVTAPVLAFLATGLALQLGLHAALPEPKARRRT